MARLSSTFIPMKMPKMSRLVVSLKNVSFYQCEIQIVLERQEMVGASDRQYFSDMFVSYFENKALLYTKKKLFQRPNGRTTYRFTW